MAEDESLRIRDKQWDEVRDLWSNYFGVSKYEDLSANQQGAIDAFLNDYRYILNNLQTVSQKLDRALNTVSDPRNLSDPNASAGMPGVPVVSADDYIGEDLKLVLAYLASDANITTEIIRSTVNAINAKGVENRYDDNYVQQFGIVIQELISKYQSLTFKIESSLNGVSGEYDYLSGLLNGFFEAGDNSIVQKDAGLSFYIEYLKKQREIRNKYLIRKDKFRKDTSPKQIMPYQCRIGAATFYIPPTNINVSQVFKTVSLSGGAIRQPNTMKTNLGHSETVISMTLYFPNHQTIWGFDGDKAPFNLMNWDPEPAIKKDDPYFSTIGNETVSDEVIDKYLSSLRGLVTQFKYAPFLPIKNAYLNQTYDINAVAMKSMTVQTMPNFPFVLMVQLELYKFNYNVYLPMIEDFDQAIHWGKYRQYMGKAVARLESMVNQGFLIEKRITSNIPPGANVSTDRYSYEGSITPRLNKIEDLMIGSKFELYYPITTPNKVFAPDTSMFTQYGEESVVIEEEWDAVIKFLGLAVIKRPEYRPNNYSRSYVPATQELKALKEWLNVNREAEALMDSGELNKFIQDYMKKSNLREGSVEYSTTKVNLEATWFFMIHELLLQNNNFFKERLEKYNIINKMRIKEWRVPMDKLNIDWDHCIVTGLNVSLSNTFASLQVQMQPEPTYQHLGGGDANVNVSMMIIGEDNLIKFRRLFDHINGLARLERKHGVLGFLGIKNVITALCGIKYVLPLSFEADTIPGFPHVYSVNLSFVDFDVMQQQREQLSAQQQKQMLEVFGSKRNPFLRLKQQWSAFSAYPDMPLDIRDDEGNVVTYFDPDWYFRSFRPSDGDLFDWKKNIELTNYLRRYDLISQDIEGYSKVTESDNPADFQRASTQKAKLTEELNQIKAEIDKIINDPSNTVKLPDGWVQLEDGRLKYSEDVASISMEEPEVTQVLGTFSDNPNSSVILSQFKGGYFKLGTQELTTGSDGKRTVTRKYTDSGMSVFSEDNASKNLKDNKWNDITSNIADHQKEYEDGSDNPNRQYSRMMEDFNYRTLKGRMVKAFPTYMLWLIDEGGKFAGIKLFDNYYSLNSVIDFSVLQSEDCIGDTLVLRLSNMYGKLTTPYLDQIISEEDPLYETATGKLEAIRQNRARNLYQGLVDNADVLDINSVRLKPGVRVHLRMGYSSNPNSLQTVFNGVITEVESGDMMTIIAQSDAVELTAMVNTTNQKGHSGKLDGGVNTGFWLSEPRDLMVRLLSMGSSNFKEFVAAGTKGMVFSDNRFGIRHFGSILYEPLNSKERNATTAVTGSAYMSMIDPERGSRTDLGVTQFGPQLGQTVNQLANTQYSKLFGSAINGDMFNLMTAFLANTLAKRDYEIFKRNIYPGNGTGIAQFMGGDTIDAGVIISTASAYIDKNNQSAAFGYSGSPRTDKSPEQLERTQQLIENITKNYQIALNIPNLPSQYGGDNTEYWGPEGQYEYEPRGGTEPAALNLDPMDNERILEILKNPDLNRELVDVVNDGGSGGLWGLTEDILRFSTRFMKEGIGATVADVLDPFNSPYLNTLINQIPGLPDNILRKLDPMQGAATLAKNIPIIGGVLNASNSARKGLAEAFQNPVSTIRKLSGSSIGKLLGITSAAPDDDLAGYDEVSFRAQTYMKTVWDLFKVCAALLPNYIVAVRPFEDRSTVFYGKPHWLYTSGVVPVTTGITNNPNAKPKIELNDPSITSLFNIARRSQDNGMKRIKELVDKIAGMDNKYLMTHGTLSGKVDPYDVGGTYDNVSTRDERTTRLKALVESDEEIKKSALGQFLLSTFNELEETNSALLNKIDSNVYLQLIQRIILISKLNPAERLNVFNAIVKIEDQTQNAIGGENIKKFYDYFSTNNESFGRMDKADFKATIQRALEEYKEQIDKNASRFANNPDVGEQFWREVTKREDNNETKEQVYFETIRQEQIKALGDQAPVKELAVSDPITFAYRFGWKLARVPAYIDPKSGYGVDKIGELARQLWEEKFSATTDALVNTRDFKEGIDTWHDFRLEYPGRKEAIDIFNQIYLKGTEVGNVSDQTDETAYLKNLRQFNYVMDLFMRFLWQDPYNRAWVVTVAIGRTRGMGVLGGDSSRRWNWSGVDEAWRTFLTDNITVRDPLLDPLEPVTAPNTRGYMERNVKPGKDPHNWVAEGVSGIGKAIGDWWDNSVGKLLSVLSDTLSGVISSIRVSLNQLGSALSMTGDMQRHANILNSMLMNSIYYQAGSSNPSDPNYLLRLCDNPFTREYGEPVVEIREPFQRMHFISSFDSILFNQIKENFENVTTVVTAVSDGKYPVTVHFDKSIPPNRQVEKTVETGLLWDNALGSGITGIFQPLLHPLETARSFAKNLTGSSDQLSARRVALYHLKESLKDIYGGEITVIGNADIRPHDLLYIADIYERMYGIVEVEQVIHHFTPETGFVTAITPNALVSVNDPVRWTMLSYMWNRMTSYNIRDDSRALLNIKADRITAMANAGILNEENIYQYFGNQLQGSIQWTQGNTAIIRDIGAMFTGGGIQAIRDRDKQINDLWKADLAVKATGVVATAGGAALGFINPTLGAVGAGIGAGLGELLWEGWEYVKNNLLDQQGCYIQYLNKDGLPMDAGLGHSQGVAVGSNHMVSLFPRIFGIPSQKAYVTKNGKFRITTNDILASLGWTEYESISAFRDTSLFVNETNANILKIANPNEEGGFDPSNFLAIKARVLDLEGESVLLPGNTQETIVRGVTDGDTIWAEVLESAGPLRQGQMIEVRFAGIDAYETRYDKSRDRLTTLPGMPGVPIAASTSFNTERTATATNNLGRMGKDYLKIKFATPESKYIAIRISKKSNEIYDKFNRILGVIFANSTSNSTEGRLQQLYSFASKNPVIPLDSYMSDGRPYTLNWEMVMMGLANVYMNDIIWDSDYKRNATGP